MSGINKIYSILSAWYKLIHYFLNIGTPSALYKAYKVQCTILQNEKGYTMQVKKTVETWAKGVKATKADALECKAETTGATETEHYKAAYNRLVTAYKEAYQGFTTSVEKQPESGIDKVVYDCFGATRKQIETLFPNREKRKSKERMIDFYAELEKLKNLAIDKDALEVFKAACMEYSK